ncbi:flagellar-associated protein 172 [Pelomyxa schiedti]|nr:flagellar-associated protein 172 [Pelomyxa schiedti]
MSASTKRTATPKRDDNLLGTPSTHATKPSSPGGPKPNAPLVPITEERRRIASPKSSPKPTTAVATKSTTGTPNGSPRPRTLTPSASVPRNGGAAPTAIVGAKSNRHTTSSSSAVGRRPLSQNAQPTTGTTASAKSVLPVANVGTPNKNENNIGAAKPTSAHNFQNNNRVGIPVVTENQGQTGPVSNIGFKDANAGSSSSGFALELDPDHPLLARVQASWAKQLIEATQLIDEEIREKEATLKLTIANREDVGARMFLLQKQYAKLVVNSQEAEAQLQIEHKNREDLDAELQDMEEINSNEKFLVTAIQAECEKKIMSLKKANQLAQQLRSQKSELISGVKLMERAAEKALELSNNTEQKMLEQDLLVDKLSEELKGLTERLHGLDDALLAYQSDSSNSSSIKAELAAEMQTLQMQKRRCQQEWQSNISAITKENELHNQLEQEIQEKRSMLLSLGNEADGITARQQSIQAENERLLITINKISTEEEHLERRLEECKKEEEELLRQNSTISAEVNQTETELVGMDKEVISLRSQSASLRKEHNQLVAQTLQVEASISELLYARKTHQKSTQQSRSGKSKVLDILEEKFLEQAKLQNDLYLLQIDIVNTNTAIHRIQKQVQLAESDLKAKNEKLSQLEVDIKKQGDEMVLKQSEIDRLNNKLEKLTSNNSQESNNGILEITIKSLTNEIAEKTRQQLEMQHIWIQSQTELIGLETQCHDIEDKMHALSDNLSTMTQTQLELHDSQRAHQRDITDLERAIALLQRDLEKLNDLISKQSREKEVLNEGSLSFQQQAETKLAESSAEVKKLDNTVSELLAENEVLSLTHIKLEEEEIQLAEKISEWKQTQEQIDPTVGATEISSLRREIHVMQLKLSKLKKKQESLIQELEKAADRRGAACLKGIAILTSDPNTCKLQAQRQISALKQQLKQSQADLNSANTSYTKISEEMATIQKEISILEEQKASVAQQAASSRTHLHTLIQNAHQQSFELEQYRMLVRKYSTSTLTRFETRFQQLESKKAEIEHNLAQLKQFIETLATNRPDVSAELHAFVLDQGP